MPPKRPNANGSHTAAGFTLFGGLAVKTVKPAKSSSARNVFPPPNPAPAIETAVDDDAFPRQDSLTPPQPFSVGRTSEFCGETGRAAKTPPPSAAATPAPSVTAAQPVNFTLRVDKRGKGRGGAAPARRDDLSATPPPQPVPVGAEEFQQATAFLSEIGETPRGPAHLTKRETVALAESFRTRHAALLAELSDLHERGWIAAVETPPMSQRVVAVVMVAFEGSVTVDWHVYPSGRSILSFTSRVHDGVDGLVTHILHASRFADETGFLTRLVRFAVVTAAQPDLPPAETWRTQNEDEMLDVLATSEKQIRARHRTAQQRLLTQEATERKKMCDEMQCEMKKWTHASFKVMLFNLRYSRQMEAQRAEESRRKAAEVLLFPPQIDEHVDAFQRTMANYLAAYNSDPDTPPTLLQYANVPMLRSVPLAISKLHWLQELDLSNCGLKDLPNLGTMQLRKLFLQKNRFKRIPDSVLTVHMRELRVLDMSHNELEVVPVEFGLLSALEVVQLDYNRIRRIECDFSGMPRLEAIDLVDNELRSLPATVGSLERLWRLKISANPLTQIPPEVYHRGVGAIKKFFSEMSPQNLAVPGSRLLDELGAWAAREGACDAVLVGRDGSRARAFAAVVQARLPGLFAAGAGGDDGADAAAELLPDGRRRLRFVSADSDLEDDFASAGGDVVVVNLSDVVGDAALQALAALLVCGDGARALLHGGSTNDAAVGGVVELGEAVRRWGSGGLRSQLQRVERGQALDANAVVAHDLEELWASGAAPVGRVARFAVGGAAEVVAVHRELLCARSEYFARMLRGGLAESAMAVVPLEGVEAEVFRAFVAYVYGDNTSKMTPENVVSLLFLAVEYDCARLKAMAECVVGLNVEVENVAQVLQVAHYLGAERLRQTCCFFAATHLSAVKRTSGWAELQEDVKESVITACT